MSDDDDESERDVMQMDKYTLLANPVEKHVRKEVRKFDPDSPEWNAQVASLVDEALDEFDPDDPYHHSKISEWVREIAKDEAESSHEP